MDRQKLDDVIAALEAIASDNTVLAAVDAEARARLQKVCGEIARPDLKARKKLAKELARKEWQDRKAADEAKRQSTAIRQLRAQPVFQTPPADKRALPPPPTEETKPPPSTEEAEQGQWRAGPDAPFGLYQRFAAINDGRTLGE